MFLALAFFSFDENKTGYSFFSYYYPHNSVYNTMRQITIIGFLFFWQNFLISYIAALPPHVIIGEEADKLKASLAAADRQRMESVARQDLMDSSDDEKDEEGNSVLSDYGRYKSILGV